MKLIVIQIAAITAVIFSEAAAAPSRRVIACEHASPVTASCPSGTYINVLEAYYGRTNSYTCGYNKKTNCLAGSSPAIIRRQCQGESHCVLKARNSVFGDPCYGVVKYIELKYDCTPLPTVNQFACEHQQPVWVECPAGHVIQVNKAYYGRRNIGTCSYKPVTNCDADGSYKKIKTQCHLQRSCKLIASNSLYGDPCRGVRKFVELNYNCIRHDYHNPHSITVCESGRIRIGCPPGKNLLITEGFYGRDENHSCKGPIKTTSCKAPGSFYKLKAQCNFKKFCQLYSSNAVFGDPCVGTKKFIKVEYSCV